MADPVIKREESPEASIISIATSPTSDLSTAALTVPTDNNEDTLIKEESPEPYTPQIKEESPEVSVMSISTVPTTGSAIGALTGPIDSVSGSQAVTPPMPKPYLVVDQDQVAPSAHHGSSPRKYSLRGSMNSTHPTSERASPVLACLPSLPTSVMATERVNTAATTTTKRSSLPTLDHPKHLFQNIDKHTVNSSNKMDNRQRGNGAHLPALPPMIDLFDQNQDIGAQPQDCLAIAFTHEQVMEAAAEHHKIMQEIITFNQDTQDKIQRLNVRVAKVESENSYLRSLLTSVVPTSVLRVSTAVSPSSSQSIIGRRSGSPPPRQSKRPGRANNDTGSDNNKTKKARNHLEIQVPGTAFGPSTATGLATPLTKSATNPPTITFTPLNNPNIPITPGRIGPRDKKSTTTIIKRKVHNLGQMVPPVYVQIPIVPLTDTEIIVYFYQCLARPIVALRMYSRYWGPSQIAAALNSHRNVDPPYLRNTCSVKCNTAFKKGQEKFGKDWEEPYRTVFRTADDVKATDMIQLSGDEIEHAVDYKLRDLTYGLIKHPKQGVDGGIFTACVKYCEETGADYTMTNVWELAADLRKGRMPNHPNPPVEPDYAGPYHPRQKRQKVTYEDPESVMAEEENADLED